MLNLHLSEFFHILVDFCTTEIFLYNSFFGLYVYHIVYGKKIYNFLYRWDKVATILSKLTPLIKIVEMIVYKPLVKIELTIVL